MTPHTGFPKGKRLLVILRDGTTFIARFDHKTDDDREICFMDHPNVRVKKIRVLSYYKPQVKVKV